MRLCWPYQHFANSINLLKREKNALEFDIKTKQFLRDVNRISTM